MHLCGPQILHCCHACKCWQHFIHNVYMYMFIIYLHTEFHMPHSSSSLAITSKPKKYRKFLHVNHVVIFQSKKVHFSKMVLHFRIVNYRFLMLLSPEQQKFLHVTILFYYISGKIKSWHPDASSIHFVKICQPKFSLTGVCTCNAYPHSLCIGRHTKQNTICGQGPIWIKKE
jgi:hypothetical protein